MTTRAIIALSLLALGAGCSKTKTKEEAKPRVVRVAPVATGELVEVVTAIGELHGLEEVHVTAQIPERIREVIVEEGTAVKAGDLLATLYSDLQRQGVDQAQAGLDAAIAGRDAAQDTVKRARLLREAGSISAAQLETAEVQARAADAQVRQATAVAGQATSTRGRTLIRAPIAGVASQINLHDGDLAAPGVVIMTIVQTDKVKAVLRVPEQDFLRIRAGMAVRISPLANRALQVTGPVSLMGPVVDRMTRTGLVEVALDNSARQLVPGSAVRAEIELGRKAGVILAPASAVLFTGDTDRTGKALAFVVEANQAKRREVRVGKRQGDRLEIVEGLTVGEALVVLGASLLRDGDPVELATAVATGAEGPAPAATAAAAMAPAAPAAPAAAPPVPGAPAAAAAAPAAPAAPATAAASPPVRAAAAPTPGAAGPGPATGTASGGKAPTR